MEKTCRNCRHFYDHDYGIDLPDGGTGECHRYPPSRPDFIASIYLYYIAKAVGAPIDELDPFHQETQNGVDIGASRFPNVHTDEWCGEFDAKA